MNSQQSAGGSWIKVAAWWARLFTAGDRLMPVYSLRIIFYFCFVFKGSKGEGILVLFLPYFLFLDKKITSFVCFNGIIKRRNE